MAQEGNSMKILIVEPGKHPRESEIDGSLKSMQKTVGGYLQSIYPFEDEVALVYDDESKLKSDTQWNRMLPETGDIIKGTFSLPDLVQKISQIFLLNLWKSTNSDFGALNFSFPHQTV